MLRSMTGFGQAARRVAGYQVQIDLKSVNHRYSEVIVRMPREWGRFEDVLKRAVQQYIKRGRVDVFVTVERDRSAVQSVQVDWVMVEAYRQAALQLKERLSLTDELTLRDLLRMPELIVMQDDIDVADEDMERELQACASEAAERLTEMREREGTHLQNDLQQRLAALRGYAEQAAELAPKVVQEHAEKLRARIQELVQSHIVIDETRLATEVAIFADRANIDEELTRLQSHFQQCSDMLRSSEAVGRKLDFLVQEMNREVNTIGSKANHATLTALVVDMKAELEKMREQIQNIE
ncbi:YicC/YloC family endoribonuclease [Paenibacillus sp. GD4]|jgi:uncharacterized protein (TIGR00255 family)|uniref:YicC/YloC family endoribonuclease n=1 Tax=Paenibacillus sp. GD4 TaxID=3068890 RepID=UPI002796D0FD|nr:YicC/YloC family endoribonuclease [Paenibacillus sp. GD4]MDQ1913174.1 YicC/YloC family endoribonuclease [Paenibacillus sp. GD4]